MYGPRGTALLRAAVACAFSTGVIACQAADQAEPCTVDEDIDGCAVIACPGSSSRVCPGGVGAEGPAGADGSSCSVEQSGRCVTIRCADGTAATACPPEPCTVSTDADDGCAHIVCSDGPSSIVCPGRAGEDGADGLDGLDGIDGTSCAVATVGRCAEITCGDGSSSRVCQPESCSVSTGADGCAIVACGQTTSATVCPGARGSDGSDGVDGVDGLDGTSCSVRQAVTCAEVTCADGTSAKVCPPDGGEPAPDMSLLDMAVKFYGAQRSGDAANWLFPDETCHTADGESMGIDLAGGWHDAGDHLKFTLTTAYAAYALFKAYDAFPEAFADRYDARYGPANGVPDVLDEAAIGADYLMRVLVIAPENDQIVARVGDATDHAQWVTCVHQETLPASAGGRPRPVVRGSYPDLAALSAAALAAGARVFRTFDAARADAYLGQARALYAFALAHAASPLFQDEFYTNSTWKDDFTCGAAELWASTSEAAFLTAAKSYDAQLGPHYWVLDYANVADLCRHTLARRGVTTMVNGGTVRAWGVDAARYLGTIDGNGLARPGGDWGMSRYALGAAFSAALYYDAFGEGVYRAFALGQLAWVTGENDAGYSFVIGYGDKFPRFPHHRNAYGVDTNPPDDVKNSVPPLRELTGGLVGGSSPASAFPDRTTDFKTSEVAIDFNAALVGAAAFTAIESTQ